MKSILFNKKMNWFYERFSVMEPQEILWRGLDFVRCKFRKNLIKPFFSEISDFDFASKYLIYNSNGAIRDVSDIQSLEKIKKEYLNGIRYRQNPSFLYDFTKREECVDFI